LGEDTQLMAKAVGEAKAQEVLIPLNRCDVLIAGIDNKPTGELLQDALEKIHSFIK
ncbi:MAG: DUF3842 family protein, partial [Erysipelotrichaceae bacterium]|nr:DUF3842 family protein [Erysipelotrichaceae bacterium]